MILRANILAPGRFVSGTVVTETETQRIETPMNMNPMKTVVTIVLATLVVALLAVVFFLLGQLSQAHAVMYRALNFNVGRDLAPIVDALNRVTLNQGLILTNQVVMYRQAAGAVAPPRTTLERGSQPVTSRLQSRMPQPEPAPKPDPVSEKAATAEALPNNTAPPLVVPAVTEPGKGGVGEP